MANTEQAVWKPYPEYPFVEANQFGEIRTKDRTVIGKDGKKYYVKGRILKQKDNGHGYMQVHFKVNSKPIYLYVHRIVAICFILNPNNLPEVNHIDNNPTNNAVSNLEWCSSEYNIEYREKYGISASEFTKVLRKPAIAISLDGFKVLWFESQHEAARKLGVRQGHITEVIKGKSNKTGGCWFCNADENAVEKTRMKFGDKIANEVERLMNEHRN